MEAVVAKQSNRGDGGDLFETIANGDEPTVPRPEIDYQLVESTRPPLYRAIKYWEKKPHNIWAQYIERYCPPGGLVCDPFAGSALAAFEAVQSGRKAIAFDLNPFSAFIIETTASAARVTKTDFLAAATKIRATVEQNATYAEHFLRKRDGITSTILNYRWEYDELVQVAFERPDKSRALVTAAESDGELAHQMRALVISDWHPTREFPRHPSVTHRFLQLAGGKTIDHLWTPRTLAVLSAIFAEIVAVENNDIRLQLLSAFVQSVHLCSKMVIPRNETADREFSGSWGRPDYLIRRRQMEQNPLVIFWRSCTGRQSVLSMIQDAAKRLPTNLTIHDAKANGKIRKTADINYGAIDIADLGDYLKPKSVDFVITDPPYAGLVRYMPLSVVWLCWLEHLDKKYEPDLQSEITVEKGSKPSREHYRRRLSNAFKQIYRVLPDAGRLVVTFHHQKVREFNEFAIAVRGAGFTFDKVTHQYNRRSGESNVANPYGVSGSDFYIRCVKRRDIDFTGNATGLENFVVTQAIRIIGERNEKTPYNFLFEALWPELLQAGFTQPQDSHDEIKRILGNHEGPGRIFIKTPNSDSRVGDYWWFNEPVKYINHPNRPLKDRVKESVLSLLRRKVSVKLDDVIAELFREYPNGLTPDPRTVGSVLQKYAFKSQGKWKIAPDTLIDVTKHSATIAAILEIGTKLRAPRFVGRREQPEQAKGKTLRELADLSDLECLRDSFKPNEIQRLEMVDAIFLTKDRRRLLCLWEVENSTDFFSAIQRGSNAPSSVPKFMVIPEERVNELLTRSDPLFRESFATGGWRYVTYL